MTQTWLISRAEELTRASRHVWTNISSEELPHCIWDKPGPSQQPVPHCMEHLYCWLWIVCIALWETGKWRHAMWPKWFTLCAGYCWEKFKWWFRRFYVSGFILHNNKVSSFNKGVLEQEGGWQSINILHCHQKYLPPLSAGIKVSKWFSVSGAVVSWQFYVWLLEITWGGEETIIYNSSGKIRDSKNFQILATTATFLVLAKPMEKVQYLYMHS